MSNNYRLTVKKGPQEGQSYSLVATMVTIGRDPMADIVITDPEVSRQHARLTRTESGYEIQDLGSTNGTFLDGQRLGGEPHQLSPGQIIAMGSNVSLVYEEIGEEVATVISTDEGVPYTEEEATEKEAGADVNVYDFPEPDEEAYGTVLDDAYDESEEEVETAPMGYEEVEEDEFELPSFEPDEEYGSLEDEELPSFDQEEDELPTFTDVASAPYGKTILEPASAAEDFEEAEEDELPSFDSGEEVYTPEPEPTGPPPPPVPPGAPPPGNNRNRNIIIALLALIFLCCCCALVLYLGYVYVGDILGCYFIEGYPNC